MFRCNGSYALLADRLVVKGSRLKVDKNQAQSIKKAQAARSQYNQEMTADDLMQRAGREDTATPDTNGSGSGTQAGFRLGVDVNSDGDVDCEFRFKRSVVHTPESVDSF